MEVGVLGEAVAYLVEEEAGRELVQTLPQPMEEMIVLDLLVRIVTWMHYCGGNSRVFSTNVRAPYINEQNDLLLTDN